jgi:hypothetical protein
MAIQSASAKLYTGIRCWCVDKNISASLSVPVTVVANVRRLKRTVIDLFPVATVSLTNQRYKTYGGGNVVNDGFFESGQSYKVLEVGDSDWNAIAGTTGITYVRGSEFLAANNGTLPEVAGAANDEFATTPDLRNASRKTGRASLSSWTARSSLVCDFPTYIRIDIEKLGLPEGTDCIVQFEEDWIVEDRGRLLPSGGYEYPNNIQGLGIPRNDNYVQFRTPWFGLSFMRSAFTMPNLARFRFRPGSMFVNSAFTPLMTAKITRRGVLDLQSAFVAVIRAGEVVRLLSRADLFVVAGPMGPGATPYLEGNGFPQGTGLSFWPQGFPGISRIRESAVSINQIVSTLSLPEFLVVLEAAAVSSSNFTVSSDVFKYKGVVNERFNSVATQSSVVNRRASGRSTMTSSTSVSLPLIRRTKQFSANLSSPQATVFCDNNSPMILVFNTSLNRLNYEFGSPERTSVAFKTVMFSIGKYYQDYNDYQANGLRDKSANITVDWGDGTTSTHTNNLTLADLSVTTGNNGIITSTGSQAEVWHTYATAGIYEVKIYGTMKHFGADLGATPYLEVQSGTLQANIGPVETLIGCKTFGQQAGLTNLSGAFDSCYNLQYYPDMIPTTVTRLESVFQFAGTRVAGGPVGFNGSAGAASWNTINVVSMAWMFRGTPMNPNISGWNVANVRPTSFTINDGFRLMFAGNTAFNRNLSGWCVNDFPTLPSGFDTGATAWTLPRPVWGTCP